MDFTATALLDYQSKFSCSLRHRQLHLVQETKRFGLQAIDSRFTTRLTGLTGYPPIHPRRSGLLRSFIGKARPQSSKTLLTVRAVHIEIAYELDTNTLLNALR